MAALNTLNDDILKCILRLQHTTACADLRDADAAAYGLRPTLDIHSSAIPEGLFRQLSQGLSTSVRSEDLLTFLNLLPPHALRRHVFRRQRHVFRRLWQYGHLLARANNIFAHKHMQPVAGDILAEHTAQLLLQLLLWFKAYSFWARYRSATLLSATCLLFRKHVEGLLVAPCACRPSRDLDAFHADLHASDTGWLNPNAVHPAVGTAHLNPWVPPLGILSPAIDDYELVSRLVMDLDLWDSERGGWVAQGLGGFPPSWLICRIYGSDMLTYADEELDDMDPNARISWEWRASANEQGGPASCYHTSLLPMRRACGLSVHTAIQHDVWLWPVTTQELSAWHRAATMDMARRRKYEANRK